MASRTGVAGSEHFLPANVAISDAQAGPNGRVGAPVPVGDRGARMMIRRSRFSGAARLGMGVTQTRLGDDALRRRAWPAAAWLRIDAMAAQRRGPRRRRRSATPARSRR